MWSQVICFFLCLCNRSIPCIHNQLPCNICFGEDGLMKKWYFRTQTSSPFAPLSCLSRTSTHSFMHIWKIGTWCMGVIIVYVALLWTYLLISAVWAGHAFFMTLVLFLTILLLKLIGEYLTLIEAENWPGICRLVRRYM